MIFYRLLTNIIFMERAEKWGASITNLNLISRHLKFRSLTHLVIKKILERKINYELEGNQESYTRIPFPVSTLQRAFIVCLLTAPCPKIVANPLINY